MTLISISCIGICIVKLSNDCDISFQSILHTYEVVVNLILVNKLCKDNKNLVEFDPYGFFLLRIFTPKKARLKALVSMVCIRYRVGFHHLVQVIMILCCFLLGWKNDIVGWDVLSFQFLKLLNINKISLTLLVVIKTMVLCFTNTVNKLKLIVYLLSLLII